MNKSFIIFEDNRIALRTLEIMLQNLGLISLGTFVSADEISVIFEEKKPNLVFMDVSLEGEMTGIEALYKLREISDVEVIFLTAYNDKKTLEEIKSVVNTSLISKPYSEFDLKEVLNAIFS